MVELKHCQNLHCTISTIGQLNAGFMDKCLGKSTSIILATALKTKAKNIGEKKREPWFLYSNCERLVSKWEWYPNLWLLLKR